MWLFFTDAFFKNAYALAGILYLEERAVMFFGDGIAGTPWKEDAFLAFRENCNQLLIQLARCRHVRPQLNFDNRVGRVGWSGKVRADGQIQQGLNDDMAITFCMCIYWADRIMQKNYPTVDYAKLGL